MTLKELRRRNNLTQIELANKISTTATAVSYWENKKRIPTMKMIPRLAEVLGTSIEDIVKCFSKN